MSIVTPPPIAPPPRSFPPPRQHGAGGAAEDRSTDPAGDGPGGRRIPRWAWVLGGLLALAGLLVGAIFLAVDGADEEADRARPPRDSAAPITLPSTVAPATSVDGAPSTEPVEFGATEVPGAPAGGSGTLARPVPVGAIADIGGGWRLQVLDVVPDATAEVLAGSEFAEAPPAGSAYTLVTVSVGYFGTADPISLFMPTFDVTGADPSTTLDRSCSTVPDELDIFSVLFAGGVVTGNLCVVTTEADRASLLLGAVGDLATDDTGTVLAVGTAPDGTGLLAALPGPRPGAAASPVRNEPVPVGTAGDVGGGWRATVDGPAEDRTDDVLADMELFGVPLPDDLASVRFVLVPVTLAYDGPAASADPLDLTILAVGAGNVDLDECIVTDGALDLFSAVPAGGQVSGTMCVTVPTSDVDAGTWHLVLDDGDLQEVVALDV